MTSFKNIFSVILTKKIFKKFIAYFLLILFIYLFNGFLWIFLLTFIFAFLFFSLGKFLDKKLKKYVDKNKKYDKKIKVLNKIFNLNVIIIIEYIVFISIFIFVVSDMLPKLTSELSQLANNIPFFREQIIWVREKLELVRNNYDELWWTFSEFLNSKDYQVILQVINRLKEAWFVFLQILLSLILSFVFIIDRKKLWNYLLKIKSSNFNFLYHEYKIIFEKIVRSFWLILKAQSMIAFVNSILTILWLYIIWFIFWIVFPFTLTLWLIVFIFWFVPVLWTFLSSIPILIISYSFVWWVEAVVYSLILIIIIHAIEAYYLNPKIVSSFLELPVSLTFIILIISEHLFWFAGLLIGVSLFYFIVWIFGDLDLLITKTKKNNSSKWKLKGK